MKQLTEEEFEAQYTCQINHIERAKAHPSVHDDSICSFNGCMYETYGADIDYVIDMIAENRVVTIIEGEDEIGDDGDPHSTIYYTSGYHLFNRMGYLIVDKPLTEDFEVKLDW